MSKEDVEEAMKKIVSTTKKMENENFLIVIFASGRWHVFDKETDEIIEWGVDGYGKAWEKYREIE